MTECRLLGFVADFLQRRGFEGTLQSLYSEAPHELTIPLDRLDAFIQEVHLQRGSTCSVPAAGGMLSEWWQVFWGILSGGSEGSSGGSGGSAGTNRQTSLQTGRPGQTKTSPPPSVALASRQMLDVESLSRIERSLLAVGLMNRDLSRLNGEEKGVLSGALRAHHVSIEAWTAYLQLCQEYTRAQMQTQGPGHGQSHSHGQGQSHSHGQGQSHSHGQGQSHNLPQHHGRLQQGRVGGGMLPATAAILPAIIDQEAVPVDSRQLLLLRQSLYQQYMLRHQTQSDSGASPLLISTPQMPLESPFYSPPRPTRTALEEESNVVGAVGAAGAVGANTDAHNGLSAISPHDPFYHVYSKSLPCLDLYKGGDCDNDNGAGGDGDVTDTNHHDMDNQPSPSLANGSQLVTDGGGKMSSARGSTATHHLTDSSALGLESFLLDGETGSRDDDQYNSLMHEFLDVS